jgi:hypothetical protein
MGNLLNKFSCLTSENWESNPHGALWTSGPLGLGPVTDRQPEGSLSWFVFTINHYTSIIKFRWFNLGKNDNLRSYQVILQNKLNQYP